jgi:hypothetical protein
MKSKLHPLKTQTGGYVPANKTDITVTFKRERERLKAEEGKRKTAQNNVRDLAEIFKAHKK